MMRRRIFFMGIAIFSMVSWAKPGFSSADTRELGEIEPIPGSPTYWGVGDGWALIPSGATCGTEYSTIGWQPSADGQYPLFIYLPGTAESYDGAAPKVVLQAMARRGFVAVSADYEKIGWTALPAVVSFGLGGIFELTLEQVLALQRRFENATKCLFDPNRNNSLVGVFCSLPNVDCSQGIVLWGYSQGGGFALHAAAYDRRVRAVWLTGTGGNAPDPWSLTMMLPHERLRVINGSTDTGNNSPESLNQLTGLSCADSDRCLVGPNDSGWYLVQADELSENGEANHAGHCWFSQKDDTTDKCIEWSPKSNLDSSWLPAEVQSGGGGRPFSVDVNADWLKGTLELGEIGTRSIAIEFKGVDPQSGLLPLPLVDLSYPLGTIAWDKDANFNVCGPNTTTAPCAPDPAVTGNYAVIGSVPSAQTGKFHFVAPEGSELQSITLVNSSPSAALVTAQILRTDGSYDNQVDRIPGRESVELFFHFGENVRTVAMTISNGAQTKIERLLVRGAAPAYAPHSTCPAQHVALLAFNGRYVSSNPYDPEGPLQAVASRPLGWETFSCVDLGDGSDGKVALKRGSVFVQSNGTNPKKHSLSARWSGPTTPGETETFTYIDLGDGEAVLRASNGFYVSADQLLPRTQLVADRSKASLWERFRVVPLP